MRNCFFLTLIYFITSVASHAQTGLSLKVFAGPNYSFSYSTTDVPHPIFYLKHQVRHTEGIQLHYSLKDNLSIYYGINLTSIVYGLASHKMYRYKRANEFAVTENYSIIETNPLYHELGIRLQKPFSSRFNMNFSMSALYTSINANPGGISNTYNYPGAIDWASFKFEGKHSKNNFLIKGSTGITYSLNNQSKLALEFTYTQGLFMLYSLNAIEFSFNGKEYEDFNISTRGSYVALTLSYEFYIWRKKNKEKEPED
jgi:hypothetical protein